MDDRQLNNVTFKDSYPLPRIDDTGHFHKSGSGNGEDCPIIFIKHILPSQCRGLMVKFTPVFRYSEKIIASQYRKQCRMQSTSKCHIFHSVTCPKWDLAISEHRSILIIWQYDLNHLYISSIIASTMQKSVVSSPRTLKVIERIKKKFETFVVSISLPLPFTVFQ